MKKDVGVFGVHGYLGGETLKLCIDLKIPCVSLGRQIDAIDISILDGLTLIIDCGFPRDYYRRKTAGEYLKEIEKRVSFCHQYGIKYVYLTTFTSTVSDKSKYARLKNLLEEHIEMLGGELLRLGLVIDSINPGGRFLELQSIIQKLPVVLIPSLNWFPIFTCPLNAYLAEVKNLLENGELSKLQIGELQPLANVIRETAIDKKVLQLSDFVTSLLARLLPLIAFGKREGIKGISVKMIDYER
jgi:hypothetical protein